MTKKPTIVDAPLRMVAYTRVSTSEQAASGLGLEAQTASIESAATLQGWSIVSRCVDAQSGAGGMRRRPGLAEALALAQSGEADGIVVSKLDRLSRSVSDFANLVCEAQAAGWRLVILDLGLDLGTPMGAFVANIMCSVAQLERELIRQRTRDALAAAKARGVHVGRPGNVPDDVVRRLHADRGRGLTLAAIADRLNAEGVPTASGDVGARWYGATVRHVLARTA